jgi:Glycosyl transferase family 2
MIHLEKDHDGFRVRWAQGELDPAAVRRHLAAWTDRLTCFLTEGDDQTLELAVTTPGQEVDRTLLGLFSQIHGYPHFPPVDLHTYRNAAEPLLSCVILLTFNDRFVRTCLIPSLIQNSQDQAIEILVVYNGLGADRGAFGNLPIIESEFGWVARGYNAGVQQARGEYVALFHDDCVITDPHWIEKCLAGLGGEVMAVTPELREVGGLQVAKGVPLVIKKQHYLELGGHDEYYYAGIEDLDFTYQILSSGRHVKQVEIGSLHFQGMSTSLLTSRDPEQLKTLFGCNMLRKERIGRLCQDSLMQLRRDGVIRLAEAYYYLYFLNKFENYLDEEQICDVSAQKRTWFQRLQPYLFGPAMRTVSDPELLIEHYRNLANAAGWDRL